MVAGTVTGLEARIGITRSDGFRLDAEVTVAPRMTTALLGPNGAGKSTVVDAIAGLVPLDAGLIALDGRVLDDPGEGVFVPPDERGVGIVFQDLLLFDHLDVAANVAFGPRSRGVPRADADRVSREWLERLGLEGLGGRNPGDLSGGQAQLVALARALATEPTMLVLDEPLSALDVAARAGIRHILAEHLEGFVGPRLLITHDPSEAFLLADEIRVIEHGAITQAGSPDEIRLRPRTRYAADLAGLNFARGSVHDGVVDLGAHRLHVADRDIEGPVVVTVHPAAVAVHIERPGGSPRNAWATTVDRVESLGDRVRLLTGDPLPLAVEVTASARAELALEPGASVWLAIKATEIRIAPTPEHP